MQDNNYPTGEHTAPSPEMTLALDFLSTIQQTGLALVPPDPTDAMVAAGMAVSGISAERTRAVFRAMIVAGAAE